MANFVPNIYFLFAIIFYEGILGGLVYVSTFALVYKTTAAEEREFAMGAVGSADAFGIVTAGLLALWLEPFLCQYQISVGRPYCGIEYPSRL